LVRAILVVAACLVAAWLVSWVSDVGIRRAARNRGSPFLARLHGSVRRPWTLVVFLAALLVSYPLAGLSGIVFEVTRHVVLIMLMGALTWLVLRVLAIVEEKAFRRLPVDIADNRRTRRARTQVGLLRRLGTAIIVLSAMGAALMTVSALRALGASLLASAGIAGVVLGLAAQTTLGHVFAGLQLVFTDTLRLDDVIVVEGEWGRVEEIRLTHAVLYLWDQRRLVLPTTYFTTTPFQNWTRHESRVLGAINLYLDYATPVDELRAEAERIIEGNPLWDRREWVMQVVDLTPSTLVARILVSAADAPSAWDLRCDIREALVEFMRTRYPQSLPRVRTELLGPRPEGDTGYVNPGRSRPEPDPRWTRPWRA
jgi:small-conductance mechanosensitive channel